YHENINDLKLYESTKNRFQTLLLNSNYISSYSSQVLDIFNHYKKGGIIGGLCDTTDEWGFCIDFNKYYTSILADMPKIPIINSFDNFQPYDNRGLEEMTLYLVKKLDNSNTYPRTEYSLCYGVNLIKQKPNVKIISFLKPSKLKTNISKGLIKEIYDTTLEPYAKKFLVNMTIGMLSKKRNRSHIHTVKTSRERDAFYIHYLQKEKVLENGFYLMSLYIYDTAEAKLTQLRQELESVGMTNISVNTDCVYTKGEHTKLDEFKRKYPYYFDFNDKNSFDSIGKLKVEAKDLPKFKNLMTMIKEKNVFTPIEKQEVNNIVLKDEWDRNEIKNIINENNRLIIKAEVPGAGKTTSLLDDNKLFVCNWNSLCFDLKKKGMNAVTYNKFFGIKWDGSSEIQGQRTKDIGNYDCVVFDEIYLYTVNQLERIALYMKENKDKKFYATGDEWQLSPIESLSVEDTKAFYNNIINSMFPNQITLKDNKRCTDKEEQQKMKEILNKIKYGTKVEAIKCLKENFKCVKNISTKKNVVAFNWTAEWVNKMLHGNKEKYYVGCELICRKTHSIKGIRTYVNYTYTVVKIDKNFITLTDGEEEIELPLSVVDENFRYSYARTCHSYQGLTENEPITIFNVGHSFVTNEWIFTAVSRATSLSNVLIYEPHLKIEEYKIDKNTIQSRIDKYLEEDKRLGRITNDEYVTVDWVLSELSKSKKCSCCKNEFDLTDLESFSTDRI
ncbi:MAG: hypothetical protein EBU90_27550, partial [Proteobacteria bacterium]|nr:hypothetical protein [Pseudomonadota bacterium]